VTAGEGWLVAQLPRVMARDPVIGGFVRGTEEIADSVRDRIGTLEHEIDIDLASPEMLAYLAGWLGVQIDSLPADSAPGGVTDARHAQRRLIRAVSETLGWRGTRRSLETLLTALTGGRVEVNDSGGVFGPNDQLPPQDDAIRIVFNQTGGLTEGQIRGLLAEELPVTARVELFLRNGGER
jgi:phage tail-like protein